MKTFDLNVGWCYVCKKYVTKSERVMNQHFQDTHKVTPIGVTKLESRRVS